MLPLLLRKKQLPLRRKNKHFFTLKKMAHAPACVIFFVAKFAYMQFLLYLCSQIDKMCKNYDIQINFFV